MFLGRAGREELEGFAADELAVFRESVGLAAGPDWDAFFAALTKGGSPRAYAFRCPTCGWRGGYADCD